MHAVERQELSEPQLENVPELLSIPNTPLRACANQYFNAIESFHLAVSVSMPALIASIARLEPNNMDAANQVALSECIDRSIQEPLSQRQLFVDISELVQRDVGTGMRQMRSILQEWLLGPPQGYRVEPVYATTSQLGYFYATKFTLNFLDCLNFSMVNDPITYNAGDVFLGLDF